MLIRYVGQEWKSRNEVVCLQRCLWYKFHLAAYTSPALKSHRMDTPRLMPLAQINSRPVLVTPREPVTRGPAKGGDRKLAQGCNALKVAPGTLRRVSVHGFTSGLFITLAKTSVHRYVPVLVGCRLNQTFPSPRSICDEVAVRTVCVTTRELDRRSAAPTVGKGSAEIVADGEAQL